MKTSSLLAALAACLIASPVLAQTAPDGRTVAVTASVPHADLDLASVAGRAKLQARIRHAVADACGRASPADLRGAGVVRRCRAETMRLASAQAERALASARPLPEAIAALGE